MSTPNPSPEQDRHLHAISDDMKLEVFSRRDDKEAMDMLEELIPAIIALEHASRGGEDLPLRLYHSMEAKLGGHVLRGPDEYFINFDMHGEGDHQVLTVSALLSDDGVYGDGFDAAELSVIYDRPEHISTMAVRGNLSLMDFAVILGDYLETKEAEAAGS